jgi:cell division septal protein FtsQ
VGVVVLAVVAWAAVAIVRLPIFHPSSIAVTGLVRVSRDDVIAKAAIDPNANAWLLDRTAIRRRIESIPYVDTARVHVRPPAAVWIEVDERTAEACVRDPDGRSATLDGALRVLETDCAGPALTYILRRAIDLSPGTFTHDPELAALAADARALAGRGDRYRAFDHDAYGELEATLDSGIRVRFGDDDDLDRKERLIGPILAQLGPRLGDVRSVDLRAPSTPVVEYRH